MKTNQIQKTIEKAFRKQVNKDKNVKNAYLLVHSDELGIHMNIAEGYTGDEPANPNQPNYMASVGKLFTSVIIGILYEKGKLSFEDSITKYLDKDLTNNLHVYKGKDYTKDITIKHLLNQTSGLSDHFWTLLEKVIDNPTEDLTPRDAVIWTKTNTTPHSPPGKKFNYTDTNYHLLGLIIESITNKPFYNALHKYIFDPLNMEHSYMHHYSKPKKESTYPTADFYSNGIRGNDIKGFASIDYSGGGVVATTEELLQFMKAVVTNKVIKKSTLDILKNNCVKFGLGIDYGYGIWKIKTVPILMPKKLNSWGVAGATGAFLFYHPKKDAYIIGNFNDTSYKSKGIRFMLLKVINTLSKYKG